MASSRARYIKLFFLTGSIVGLFILGIPVALFFLGSLAALHLSGLLNPRRVAISKITFDRDTSRFRAFIENKTNIPLKLSYAIRSVTPVAVPSVDSSSLDAGFMQGSSSGTQYSRLLLSENNAENTLEPDQTSILESNDAAAGMWSPGLQSSVHVTASYYDSNGKRPDTMSIKLPLELSRTHPYLREVGAARAFMLTRDDGTVVGSAKTLAELARQVRQNPSSFLSHMENNDIHRWVLDVIGDAVLHDRLRMLGDVSREDLPAMASEVLSRRIGELSDREFRGIHPLLSDVEEWHAFNLKTNESNVICACRSLAQLFNALFKSSHEAVAFHTTRGNDFATWIQDVVGDRPLAERIRNVDTTNAEQAQARISMLIYRRIQELR